MSEKRRARDLAVEIVDAIHGYTIEYSDSPQRHRTEYELVEDILARAASTPEAAGWGDAWISVAERMPEDETPVRYVVVPRGGEAYVKFGERSYDAGAECFWWCDSDGNFTEEGNEPGFSVVTHWQTIPVEQAAPPETKD